MNASETRAAGRLRSRGWWEQRRALGICAVCRAELDRDRNIPIHPYCSRLLHRGYRYADVRRMSPAERQRTSRS